MADSGGQKGRVFSVLFEITQRLNEGAQIESVLADIARAATELSGGDHCSVMLLDEARSALLCRAAHGLTDAEIAGIGFRVGEGVAGWVAEHDEPVRLADASLDPRFKQVDGQTSRIRSLCCVPLSTREGVIGVVSASAAAEDAFAEEDERLLRFLASSIVKDVENARLYRLAVTDSLTRCYNRQWLGERLPAEMERCRRYGDALSVILVDVDHFKRVNDGFGHAAGDQVLVAIADRAQQVVREVDAVVRYGGEEFLLLLPSTDREGARVVAERLRAQTAGATVPTTAGEVSVTLSAGVAEMTSGDASVGDLVARADAALYEAKGAGRDRIVVAP